MNITEKLQKLYGLWQDSLIVPNPLHVSSDERVVAIVMDDLMCFTLKVGWYDEEGIACHFWAQSNDVDALIDNVIKQLENKK